MATRGNITPRADLAGAFAATSPQMQKFVALNILPPLSVQEISGYFGKIPAEAYLTDLGEQVNRKSKGARARSDFEMGEDFFAVKEYSAEEAVDLTDERYFQNWDSLLEIASIAVAERVMLRHERVTADLVYNTTTFALSGDTGANVGTEWSTGATATPIGDLNVGKSAIEARIGTGAFSLLINDRQARALSNTEEILDRLKHTTAVPGRLTAEQLAFALDFDEVIIASSHYTASNPGDTTPTFSSIWSNEYAFLFRKHEGGTPGRAPGLGRTFVLDGDAGLSVGTYPDEKHNSEVVFAERHMQAKIIYPEAGYLLGNIIA